jgi:hypothetical protein
MGLPAVVPPGETEACVRLGKFTFTSTGMLAASNPTLAEWMAAGSALRVLLHGLQFAIGDWLNYGEAQYGELAAQAIDARDWSPETVRVYRWVAAKVPPQNRMMEQGLSFQHHQAVAKLTPAKQKKWLQRAAAAPEDDAEAWTVNQLKAAIKGGDTEDPPAPTRWWVLVEMRGEQDQEMFMKEMEQSGRVVKAVTRKGDNDD